MVAPPSPAKLQEKNGLLDVEVRKAAEASNDGSSTHTDGQESQEKGTPSKKSEKDRGTWSGKLDFVMSALSFAVGMGNIWRFPYMCYRNGGGAFLIPYLIMVVLAGFPLMFLELAFGQYGSLGVVSIWRAVPLLQGIGWCMFAISFISCIYYNMLIAYSFFYLFASLASDVPWRNCGNDWNSEGCGGVLEANCTAPHGTWYNGTCHYNLTSLSNITTDAVPKPRTASDEYFHNYMLDMSDGVDQLGGVRWHLCLCLLLCWLIVFICLSRGIKSSGKVTYVTSVFPYIILIIILARGLTLDGSTDGIMYYLTPTFSKLGSAKVWGDAAVQVFFSMSTCWGGLITLASYNKFNNNCLRDSIVVAVGDCLTSVFAGVVIFSVIGYMAKEMGVHIDEVATDGAGLAFIVYPSVVTRLPLAPLWAILFMLMLINLGLGTQLTLVTTAHTTLLDIFSTQLRRGRRPLLLLLVICVFCFTVGLTMTTRAGMYVLQLMDSYAPSYALLIGGLAELLTLSWVYGIDRFMKNIEDMLQKKPSIFFKIMWQYVTPILITLILLFSFVDFKGTTYGEYEYPVWAEVIGWLIVLLEVGLIPGVAVYKVLTLETDHSIIQKIKLLCKPAHNWGPASELSRVKTHNFEDGSTPLNAKEVELQNMTNVV